MSWTGNYDWDCSRPTDCCQLTHDMFIGSINFLSRTESKRRWGSGICCPLACLVGKYCSLFHNKQAADVQCANCGAQWMDGGRILSTGGETVKGDTPATRQTTGSASYFIDPVYLGYSNAGLSHHEQEEEEEVEGSSKGPSPCALCIYTDRRGNLSKHWCRVGGVEMEIRWDWGRRKKGAP